MQEKCYWRITIQAPRYTNMKEFLKQLRIKADDTLLIQLGLM